MHGLVIRSQSGFFTVETNAGEYICKLRGRLLKGRRRGDVVAVGDRVQFTPVEHNTGMIEEVEPRKSMFSRLSPEPQGEYEQILIANPDEIVLVFSCDKPAPRFGMLDRFLVIAEKNGVPAAIIANKTDLVDIEQRENMFNRYSSLGYPVIFTSVKTKHGIEIFKDQLQGKISLLTGPSGVGKSSLLNAIQPDLGLQVRQVSQTTSKGRHTTVVRELFPLEEGGYVADTPGLKALALFDIEPEELDAYFPEIKSRVAQCAFSNCTHVHEPKCAVREAVMSGDIHPDRYQSYVRIRLNEKE
jgi:ribosome biogenesis GTPase